MLSDATDVRRVWWLPLVGFLLSTGLQVQALRVTLRDVCTNAQVPIMSVDDFGRILDEFRKDNFEICPRSYRLAFTMLEPIILDKQQPICGGEKFALIERFHSHFIPNELKNKDEDEEEEEEEEEEGKEQISTDEKSPEEHNELSEQWEERALCPVSLQQLFKAYTLQVSGLCKQRLVENLNRATQSMSDDDFELFEVLKLKSAAESQALLGRADEFVGQSDKFQYHLSFRTLGYMSELRSELEKDYAQVQQEKIRTSLHDQLEVNKLMRTCRKRFRPIYSELVLPIVRLAKLGYDYDGDQLDRFRNVLKSEDINTWLMVTLICESNSRELDNEEEEGQEIRELNFEPIRSRPVEGELWIKEARQLAYEFRVADLMQQKGFQKFLADSQLAGRRLASTLDPKQFAWYRDNEGTIKLISNTARILAQFFSKVAKNG